MPDLPHGLDEYRRKRRAGVTPEPFGAAAAMARRRYLPSPMFVVQQHAARNLHFDFRLEIDGVLKSWAVPKGPSTDPHDKRFAAFVEDHPLDYADFEGRIPEGNYGAGTVIVWDRGAYQPLNDLRAGIDSGKLLFELRGHKLRGRWTLVRMKNEPKSWLLIKEHDQYVRTGEVLAESSVLSGLSVQALRDGNAGQKSLQKSLARTRAPAWESSALPTPMLAGTADAAFDRAGWLFEFKLDGYRLLIDRRGDQVRLIARNGGDLTDRLPDLALVAKHLPVDDALIDGEVVVHDAAGRPNFGLLQAHLAGSAPQAVRFWAFDLLRLAGRDLRGLPLTTRKRLLQSVVPELGCMRYVEHVATHGLRTWDTAMRLGLEGIMAKRADSLYRSARSNDWLKVRALRTDDFVVVGWTDASNNAKDLGALLLAEYRNEVLTFVGRVGTGFTHATRKSLLALVAPLPEAKLQRKLEKLPKLKALAAVPNAHWVAPQHVVEVRYREYTSTGQLRMPVFVRVREDKDAKACIGRFDSGAASSPTSLAASSSSNGDSAKATSRAGATEAAAASDTGKLAGKAAPAKRPAMPITNAKKIFWPEDGLTKGDLVEYYRGIAPWLLPYLRDRPVVLTRYPDGIHGKSFFQKDAPTWAASWLRSVPIWSEGSEREINYFIIEEADGIAALANMGSIPLHIWSSRIDKPERPDWCILDLDPKGAPFAGVRRIAAELHALGEELGLPHYLKTTGSSGLHVLFPLARLLDHEQSKVLGELLARVIVHRLPDIATINRAIHTRDNKVYVDYLQNGHGKLLVAPFSARPVPGAHVSMPVRWDELNGRLNNARFSLSNAVGRMRKLKEDPLLPVLTDQPDLQPALEKLQRLVPG